MPVAFDDDGALMCPVCGGGNLHQVVHEVFERDESGIGGLHTKTVRTGTTVDSDMAGNPSPRRQGAAITMDCENMHGCKLVIFQHKGSTYIEWEQEHAS